MENSKKSYGTTWTNEQSSSVNIIEQKYRRCIFLADMQGLKVNKEELIVHKRREIKAILSSSQFEKYANLLNSR